MTDVGNTKNTNNILTPKKCILSFPQLGKAKEFTPGDGRPRYTCQLVFPPELQETPEFKAMVAKVVSVAQAEWGSKTKTLIKAGKIRVPFRPRKQLGEELPKQYPDGSVYITCGRPESWGAPGLVDWNLDETNVQAFYAGALVRAHLTVFPYSRPSKGVSFGLNHLQKLGDGERLDSGSTIAVSDAFTKEAAPEPADLDDLPGPHSGSDPDGDDDTVPTGSDALDNVLPY